MIIQSTARQRPRAGRHRRRRSGIAAFAVAWRATLHLIFGVVPELTRRRALRLLAR
jgi:hypothetical protein